MKPTSTNEQAVEQYLGSEEEARDLAQLQELAGVGAQQEAELEPVQQGPGLAEELEDLFGLGVATLGAMYPSVPKNCKPESVKMLAAVWAGVGEKYGWEGVMGGQYGKELTAGFFTLPIAMAVYKGIKADIAASKPAQPLAELGGVNLAAPVVADQTPGAKTVTVGVAA